MAKRGSLDKREKENPKVMRGVMSAFVSSSSTDDVTENDTNNKTINVTNSEQNKAQKNSENNTSSVANNNTDNITNVNTNNNTEKVTSNVTNKNTENETKDVTKDVTNKVPKITHVKSIKIGSKTLESTYASDESTTRCAYHLRKDTIDKIEECSKLSGMKKAEFVDLVLNSALTEILNKANKK
ncbi:MAG: hypothetical protein RSD22_06405 [Romboutsia sp.]